LADSFVHGLSSGSADVPPLAAWDALPDPLVLTRPNGTITFANGAACELLGWRLIELVGQPIDVLVAEDAPPPAVDRQARWRDGVARHRDGDELPVSLWHASSPGAAVLVLRDLRPARQREAAERLDGLAELAGSLAHEFNNLLAVILSSAGFLADSLPSEAAAAAGDVERIREAAERGARLTRHLLGSTGVEKQRGEVDVGALIQDVVRLVEWATGGSVRLRLDPALPAISGDRRELEQLILGLALDPAQPRGGSVTLTGTASADGRSVELAVGCAASVFALTAAYTSVRRLGGSVTVDEGPGGTVVRLVLPVADGPVLDLDAPATRAVILVVDDAEALRQLTARALQQHGYVVLEAGTGEEALRLVQANVVDLVLTDVVMPGMSGLEVADAVAALPEAPPVVLMSGYSDDVVPPERSGDVPLLRKPFSEQALLDHVRAGVLR
jgi:two-component system cell cycle sensor histidine kinase/response regulator CckA